MALIHLAGTEDIPASTVTPLAPNAPANLDRWSPQVRSMVLQMEFFQHFGTQYHPPRPATQASGAPAMHPAEVSVTWAGAEFASIIAASAETLAKQVPFVQHYAEQRGDRAGEILTQLGTLTDYFTALLGIPTGRASHLVELLSLTQQIAGMCAMPAKHMLACRRPDELDSRLMPLIPTPAHGSQPSGHATQAIAIATVLNALLDATAAGDGADVATRKVLITAQAHRIAVNRTVAGLHYPMDNWAGAVMGRGVGTIIASLGLGTGPDGTPLLDGLTVLEADSNKVDYTHIDYDSEKGDFFLRHLRNMLDEDNLQLLQSVRALPDPDAGGANMRIKLETVSDTFAWLWGKALEDLQHLTGTA